MNFVMDGYRFGVFELNLDAGELRRSGVRVRLAPQPLSLLTLLVSNAGRLVEREEIIRHLWPETFVDHDAGLKSCIKQIRQVLRDSPVSSRFIETVPKRGYRFIAPVERLVAGPAAGPRSARSRRARAIAVAAGAALLLVAAALAAALFRTQPSAEGPVAMAVLSFEDHSPGEDQAYLSDGFTEELITRLANLDPENVKVIARTSSMIYKDKPKPIREIARELHVHYVLEGSLRREQDRVRLTAQLIRADDESHVWAESYDRQVEDLLEIQSDIARRVVDSVAGRIIFGHDGRPAHRLASSQEARDAYLKGMHHLRNGAPRALAEAMRHLEEAVALDPGYAPALEALASALLREALQSGESVRDLLPAARDAADRAIAIDASLADAHATRATAVWYLDWDWDAAERDFERAVSLAPGSAHLRQQFALFLAVRVRHDQARAQIEIARRLDPLSVSVNVDTTWIHFFARRYDEAIAEARRTLGLQPESFVAWYGLASALEQAGRIDEAGQAYREMSRRAGVPEAALAPASGSSKPEGNRVEQWWMDPGRNEGPALPDYDHALIFVSRGDHDRAFELLDRAVTRLSGWVSMVAVDPRMDPLRNDPRFEKLLRRMNLTSS